MAGRVLGTAHSHVLGAIDDLLVAEATAALPPLAGHTLAELDVRQRCGVDAVGVWERGQFHAARANGQPDSQAPGTRSPDAVVTDDVPITPCSVVILAGTADQLACFDDTYGTSRVDDRPVVILGGGRVGKAAGKLLDAAGIEWRIVEREAGEIGDPAYYVHGEAADGDVLEAAGLRTASTVLVTTHEDDMNVFLTLYVRRLRPDVQILSRANADRNVSTLHRAGADAVLSYASLGATAIWNELGADDSLVVAEGLDVFRAPVPAWLAGRTLADSDAGSPSGCSVLGLVRDGSARVERPDPDTPIPAGASLVLIGDGDAQERFFARGAD
jgi:voltage-gated potassium channel